MMDKLEILENKVRQAAEQLSSMHEEQQRLKSELSFLEEENKRTREMIKENESWKHDKKSIAHRIEKVLKKLNALKA